MPDLERAKLQYIDGSFVVEVSAFDDRLPAADLRQPVFPERMKVKKRAQQSLNVHALNAGALSLHNAVNGAMSRVAAPADQIETFRLFDSVRAEENA